MLNDIKIIEQNKGVSEEAMNAKELGKLAKEKKIKLEDLEIEDILKFGELGFINNALCEYFDLSKDEVKSIRKKKGLTNYDLENFIRDMIVIYYYINRNYKEIPPIYATQLIKCSLDGFINIKSYKDFYKREMEKIDWINLNPEQEIKVRKIDLKNRENSSHMKQLYKILDQNLKMYQEEFCEYNSGSRNIAKKSTVTRMVNAVPRNSNIATNALKRVQYHCELNPKHDTFISRFNNMPYMEAHHLIPLKFQAQFENSLDIEENIISLCSKCHAEIHKGINYKTMLLKLYKERKKELYKRNLNISIDELYKMYETEKVIV